jgi:hypothetical protein
MTSEGLMNRSRLVGLILAAVGIGLAALAGLWLATQTASGISSGGVVVGAFLAFIPVAILVGFGLYLYNQGGVEVEQESEMEQQRQILDIVKSRGQVSVTDLALEMKVNVGHLKSLIHQLVGLQVFSGYINWDEGVLYSSEASNLRSLDKCKNCGGEITLAGKGIVVCKYCGTEYFLS